MPTATRVEWLSLGRRAGVAATLLLLIGCSSSGTTGYGSSTSAAPSGVDGKGQAAELQAAAVGTWTGANGTLKFHGDGTAEFSLKLCGTSDLSSANFHIDCESTVDTVTGTVKIRDHSIELDQSDGSGTTYDAYLDHAGKLHVGAGTIGELTAERKGDVNISTTTLVLHVRSTCTVADTTADNPASQPTPCQFTTRDGEPVLTATLPNPFDKTKTKEYVLVYDAQVGLVVDPTIFVSSYTRS